MRNLNFLILGATDLQSEGTWRWDDGRLVTNNFWGQKEPNGGDGTEDCMSGVYAKETVEWSDVPCERKFMYACQRFSNGELCAKYLS